MTTEKIAFLIIGIFNIIFGFSIKKYKLANTLTFYNEKKDKKNKDQIEKIAGNSFFIMGLFMVFLVILGHFTNINENYFVIIQTSILIGFALLMILKSRDLRKSK